VVVEIYTQIYVYILCVYIYIYIWDRGRTVVKVLCYKSEGHWFDPTGVIGFFIDIKSFRSHYGPWVDSTFNRNEYQDHFLWVKAAGA